MMRVLLVEDDDHKRDHLSAFLGEILPDAVVSAARSYRSGVRSAVGEQWDLVVLDITMLSFDPGDGETGGRPQVYAGVEIMRQMKRLGIGTPVIAVTQFGEFGKGGEEVLTLAQVSERLQEANPDGYRGVVYYNPVLSDWKRELARMLKELVLGWEPPEK